MTVSTTLFTEISAAIAGLTFSGITNSATPLDSAMMSAPIFYPRPVPSFIDAVSVRRETFGAQNAGKMTLRYTLNYMYLHAPIAGGLGGTGTVWSRLITNLNTIYGTILQSEAIAAASSSITLPTILNPGPVTDPAGNEYWGCEFAIAVEVYIN